MMHPECEIRAYSTPLFIRVIADSALKHQTFISPPFSMSRMTWVKPSFLWLMYRSGWGRKDKGQKRILAIDITHAGFAWALNHSCPSHRDPAMSEEEWRLATSRRKIEGHKVAGQWPLKQQKTTRCGGWVLRTIMIVRAIGERSFAELGRC
jgi:hypothetical protein